MSRQVSKAKQEKPFYSLPRIRGVESGNRELAHVESKVLQRCRPLAHWDIPVLYCLYNFNCTWCYCDLETSIFYSFDHLHSWINFSLSYCKASAFCLMSKKQIIYSAILMDSFRVSWSCFARRIVVRMSKCLRWTWDNYSTNVLQCLTWIPWNSRFGYLHCEGG